MKIIFQSFFVASIFCSLFANNFSLKEQLLLAEEGDEINIPEGVFIINDHLSLYVDAVKLKGSGRDKSILVFSGESQGAEGLYINANNITLEDFEVYGCMDGTAVNFDPKANRKDGSCEYAQPQA